MVNDDDAERNIIFSALLFNWFRTWMWSVVEYSVC